MLEDSNSAAGDVSGADGLDQTDPASAPPEEPGSDLGEDIDGQLQILDPDEAAQSADDDGEAGEPA
jgi:hypothetical protein